jgi:hypothetical protein
MSEVASPQDSARIEKVMEGQYLQWQDGHPLMDTAQAWTIWRTSEGYEIEDKLPTDKSVMLMGAMGTGLKGRMSPQVQELMKDLTMKTDVRVRLTKQRAIQGLVLDGKKLSDSKQIEMTNCIVKENEIFCKSHEASAHLKNSSQDCLLYSYAFPLLFSQILKQSQPVEGQTIPVSLAVLEEVNNKFELTRVPAQLRGAGRETVVVGQHAFDTEKVVLAFDGKSGSRQITLWKSNQGIVLAMEDSRFAPGLRVVLSQYKKYSDF